MTDNSTINSTRKYRWYIMTGASGREQVICRHLKEKIESKGMEEHFEEILAPTVDVTRMKSGKQTTVAEKVIPGYILFKMDMNPESYDLVKSVFTNGLFLGPNGKPVPVSESEIQKILNSDNYISEGHVFLVDDKVKITEGPFEGFSGVITELEASKSYVKIEVSIFGSRTTMIELEINQIEKL